MSCERLLLAACCALTVTACAIGKPIPQPATYIVDPPAGTAIPSELRRPEALRVGNVRVAAPYAGNALIYRLDDVRYVSDPYNQFVADPGSMLGSQIAQWLDREGRVGAVSQPGSTRSTPYVLEATVTELYGDFRTGRPPAAVLGVQFALIEQIGIRPKVICERTMTRRIDLPKASPDELVRGYGTALAQILLELAPELSARIVH
jgi:cholesterol transport system auxiliary component